MFISLSEAARTNSWFCDIVRYRMIQLSQEALYGDFQGSTAKPG